MRGPVVTVEDRRARAQVEALYREHGHRVLGYLARRSEHPEDAADMMSEVMLVTWRRRSDLPGSPDDVLWVFGVARNVVAGHWRKGTRRTAAVGALADLLRVTGRGVAPSPADGVDAGLDLRRALQELAPIDREIVTLNAWEGLTSAEIGVVLGMPAATVRSRLRRARAGLRTGLAEVEVPEPVAPGRAG